MGFWNTRGLRGSTLEQLINQTNDYYAQKNLALIQKIPTPITPVKIDKNDKTITLAYFEKQSTVDYIGAVQGIPVCFDAKETTQKSLKISHIHEHQIEFMRQFQQQGGVSFLLVHFTFCDRYFFLPFSTVDIYYKNSKSDGRKSIPFADFPLEYEIFPKGGAVVHYLDALSSYLQDN